MTAWKKYGLIHAEGRLNKICYAHKERLEQQWRYRVLIGIDGLEAL